MSSAAAYLPGNWIRCQRWSLLVGIAGLVVLSLGGVADPQQFFRAYLAAYLFYFGIGMGCMALLMIYHITGGAWGFLIRRTLEAGMRTMPLLAIGFVPIVLGAPYLYPFAMPDMAANAQILKQQAYMNLPFFSARAAVFFVLWLAWSYALTAASRRQDRTGDPRWAWRCDGLSGTGLLIYGVTIHFASIDWIMSLQPAFHSTIFGPMAASGHLLCGLAFAWIVLACLHGHPPLAEYVSPKALNDLGSLLFAFVIIWTYMGWFQYMLIWIANLPVDVIWYLPRIGGGWFWVAMALILLNFVVPFLLLLWRSVKQNPPLVARIAGLLLLMQMVFMQVLVQPAFAAQGIAEHWMDVVAPLGLGGIWLAYFVSRLRGWPLLPLHDFNQAGAVHLRRSGEEEAEWEEMLAHE